MDENNELDLQQMQAETIVKAHEDMQNGVEGADKRVNEGIKGFVTINNSIKEYEELEFKKEQAEAELDFKKDQLGEQQRQHDDEMEFKREQLDEQKRQYDEELKFKKEQAEEAKKARLWDILSKVGIAVIPIIISSIFTVIVVKITCKENRNTLMATMFANEVMERAGEISNVTAKDITREALKQATNVKFK